MAGTDPLEGTLDKIRETVAVEQRAAEERRIEEERRLAESRASEAHGLEQLEALGISFVARARRAGIDPEPVVFRVQKLSGIFRKRVEWENERRRAWVVSHYHSGNSYGDGYQAGIYVLENGELYSSLQEDDPLKGNVARTIEACARYLVQRGA